MPELKGREKIVLVIQHLKFNLSSFQLSATILVISLKIASNFAKKGKTVLLLSHCFREHKVKSLCDFLKITIFCHHIT